MIDQLRSRIAENKFEYTRHALDQSILRGISAGEVREAFENGEIIEDYPNDKSGAELSGVWYDPIGSTAPHPVQSSIQGVCQDHHALSAGS